MTAAKWLPDHEPRALSAFLVEEAERHERSAARVSALIEAGVASSVEFVIRDGYLRDAARLRAAAAFLADDDAFLPRCSICTRLLVDGGVKDGDELLCLSCGGEE